MTFFLNSSGISERKIGTKSARPALTASRQLAPMKKELLRKMPAKNVENTFELFILMPWIKDEWIFWRCMRCYSVSTRLRSRASCRAPAPPCGCGKLPRSWVLPSSRTPSWLRSTSAGSWPLRERTPCSLSHARAWKKNTNITILCMWL